MSSAANRLADATSPYLQQHAHNPVNWWPWCDEALDLARREDRPILLSIGYSACHWCHVMAHESFDDEDTAAVMNRLFVNIKVDREERPDLDKIYQSAHQLLSQRPGGWPLTMFLTPDDQVPFFGGTYFPPAPRHGLPAFKDLLVRIEAAYRNQGTEIRAQNVSMLEALESLNPSATSEEAALDPRPLAVAREQLRQSFDAEHGGFGRAPKFPHPTNLEFLLRQWRRAVDTGRGDEALHMATYTLERMIEGGVSDQVGGGFCRYSVDDQWMIPHFEKMLYDNGPLLALCCDAWQATGKALFKRAAETTAEWVMREMQSPQGGYYSTLDADSEGEEGRFYVWDFDEARTLLTTEEFALLTARYSDRRRPNFEGRWHLHGYQDPSLAAAQCGLDASHAESLLHGALAKLFDARAQRVRPGRDEKILTAWNALMIQGMARAGRVLGRTDYLASARSALDFLRTTMWHDGRLLATYKDGKAHLAAYLDDHAYLIDALLELMQAQWRREDLDFAVELAELLLRRFEDPAGGFYFTADDHEALIHRPKPLGDDSTPSGNGVAAYALLRLGHLLGERRYLDAAERALRFAWPHLSQMPYAHASLLKALDAWLEPEDLLVIRADSAGERAWKQALPASYAPRTLALFIPGNEGDLPGLLAERRFRENGVAYLCRGSTCLPPITHPQDLASLLQGG